MAPKKKQDESSQNLRKVIIDELSTRESGTKRDVPVMTRFDNELVSMLDILVKLDIFKSRSEAIASIVEKTLFVQRDKFELLKAQITKLEKIQDTAKDIASDVLKG